MKKNITGGLTIPSRLKNEIINIKKLEAPTPKEPNPEEPIFFEKIKEKINRIQDDKLRNKLEEYWKKTQNRDNKTQTLKIEDNSTLTIVSRMV
jgi:hypothetical protein